RAVQGTVWSAPPAVGAALAALYRWATSGGEQPRGAGLALGLGFATRTPLGFAFPLFVVEAWRARGDDISGLARRFALFAAPAAAALAVLLWLNRARFGDPLQFGHRYLDIAWRGPLERW